SFFYTDNPFKLRQPATTKLHRPTAAAKRAVFAILWCQRLVERVWGFFLSLSNLKRWRQQFGDC
ncbi:Hypothetical predicted protein, partial [Olea europaea subsp. europaea]